MTKIQLKRSNALQSSTVSRAPTASQLDYGELAINYNSADPQLFIKDSSGSVLRLFDYYAKVSGTTFTGDVNFDGELTIQGDSTNGSGQLTLTCEQNTHSVKIKAPAHSAAANYTLTLPSSAGSNSNVLTTDGSGNLSWALSSMSTADKNKLDGIESGATADQTGAEIKSLYEGESNTNAFTDAEKVKLSGIAAGAEVNVGTDLSYTATSRLLSSSTGSDVNLPEATPSQPGLLSAADKAKLNAIETSATADQTATEILTAIRTVDGSGSGLDADTVDGLESSRITRNSGGLTTNLDTFYDADMFGWATSTTGRPESYGQGISIVSSGRTHNNANNWITQLAFGTSTTQAYFRTKVNSGGWTSWHKIWNSANDGAGSGLDADTLDGIQGTNYFRCDGSYPNTDMNSTVQGYWHVISTASNLPVANYGHRWDWDHVKNGQWVFQMYSATSGGDDLWYRQKRDYSAQPWRRVYSSGSRDIYLNTGATGSTGNEITVGNSSPQHTLRDTNLRPIVQVTGQYPCISLNHTATGNANHGPTIQFSHNGYDSNEQIVVGTTGQGKYLDVGFSGGGYGTNSNYNPHNGISGYSGKTPVRIFNNGVLVGATGTYPNHIQSTSHALESIGTTYLQGSNDRPLRVLKSSGYNSCAALFENQYGNNSWGIVSEYRVGSGSGSDRPSILFSSGYNTDTWSVGFGYTDSNFRIKIDHGWRNQGWGSDRMIMDRSGNVTFSGNVTAYSDVRLKENINPLTNCLENLIQLNGVSFTWKDLSDFIGNVGQSDFGIIAQEVEEVFPEVVRSSSNKSEDGDYYKTVAYEKLIPVLIESIKELKQNFDDLAVELNSLKGC